MTNPGTTIARVAGRKSRTLQPSYQPLDPDCLYSVDESAARGRLSRGMIYRALCSDPAKRGGLPHLKSVQVGKARRIRGASFRTWLDELEEVAAASE